MKFSLVTADPADLGDTGPMRADLVPPMLAAAGSLPGGPGWAFEFKYDGVRAVTYAEGGPVRAYSRNGNDITAT